MHTRDAFLCSQTTLLLVHRLCASYPRSKSVKVFYFFFFFACRDIDCLINVCLHDAIFPLLTVFVIRYVLIGRIFSMEIGQVSLQDNSLLFYVYIYTWWMDHSLNRIGEKIRRNECFVAQSPCNFPYRMECRGRWLSRPWCTRFPGTGELLANAGWGRGAILRNSWDNSPRGAPPLKY